MNTDSARLCFVVDAVGALQKPNTGCTPTIQVLTAYCQSLGWVAAPSPASACSWWPSWPSWWLQLTQADHLALMWDMLCDSDDKESTYDAGYLGSIPGSGISPGEGNGNPTLVFLPGESHGQRSLEGYIQSMGSQRVGHVWATKHFFSSIHFSALELPVGSGWRQPWNKVPSLLFFLPSSYSASLTFLLWREVPILEAHPRFCFWGSQPPTRLNMFHIILSSQQHSDIVLLFLIYRCSCEGSAKLRTSLEITSLNRYKSQESNPASILNLTLLTTTVHCHLSNGRSQIFWTSNVFFLPLL